MLIEIILLLLFLDNYVSDYPFFISNMKFQINETTIMIKRC